MVRLDSTITNLLAALSRLRINVDHLDRMFRQVVQDAQEANVEVTAEPIKEALKLQEDLDVIHESAKTLSQRLDRAHELISTSALLTSTLEISQVLEKVIDTVIRLSGAERAYLMLREGDSDELTIQEARNYDHETLSPEEASFSRGIVYTAIDRREPVLTTNAKTDSRFADLASVTDYTLRSVMVIPLILRDEVIGVLYVDNRLKDGQFKKDLVSIMVAFANQAAIAIENARLFAEIKADLDAAKSEVRALRIQIDPEHARQEISDIVDNDFFKRLQNLARGEDTTD